MNNGKRKDFGGALYGVVGATKEREREQILAGLKWPVMSTVWLPKLCQDWHRTRAPEPTALVFNGKAIICCYKYLGSYTQELERESACLDDQTSVSKTYSSRAHCQNNGDRRCMYFLWWLCDSLLYRLLNTSWHWHTYIFSKPLGHCVAVLEKSTWQLRRTVRKAMEK